MLLLQNVVVTEQNVSGGTIKIKIYEHGDLVSVILTDDFTKHFPDVDFTAFHNRKWINS